MTITFTSGGRRLQTGASVIAAGASTDATVVDSAKTSAGDTSELTSALKQTSATKFVDVNPAIQKQPTVAANLEIVQRAADANAAAALVAELDKKLIDNEAAIIAATGAQSLTGIWPLPWVTFWTSRAAIKERS